MLALRRAALTEGGALEALRVLVPPPDVPYLGGGTWERLFNESSTRLPAEYMALMECYGAGCWSNWLRFVAPLSIDGDGFVQYATAVSGGCRSLREEFPEEFPLKVWPELGGFRSWNRSFSISYGSGLSVLVSRSRS